MDGLLRERRRAELISLWKSNPHKVLSLYRELAELDELAPLPPNITFGGVIDTILERAASDGPISLQPH